MLGIKCVKKTRNLFLKECFGYFFARHYNFQCKICHAGNDVLKICKQNITRLVLLFLDEICFFVNNRVKGINMSLCNKKVIVCSNMEKYAFVHERKNIVLLMSRKTTTVMKLYIYFSIHSMTFNYTAIFHQT